MPEVIHAQTSMDTQGIRYVHHVFYEGCAFMAVRNRGLPKVKFVVSLTEKKSCGNEFVEYVL